MDGPFGKIEACHHSTSVSGFTDSPSASELTPAVTTFSPADKSVAHDDRVRIEFGELDLAALNLVVLADHPDLRLISGLQQRGRGKVAASWPSVSTRPTTTAPRRISGGGEGSATFT